VQAALEGKGTRGSATSITVTLDMYRLAQSLALAYTNQLCDPCETAPTLALQSSTSWPASTAATAASSPFASPSTAASSPSASPSTAASSSSTAASSPSASPSTAAPVLAVVPFVQPPPDQPAPDLAALHLTDDYGNRWRMANSPTDGKRYFYAVKADGCTVATGADEKAIVQWAEPYAPPCVPPPPLFTRVTAVTLRVTSGLRSLLPASVEQWLSSKMAGADQLDEPAERVDDEALAVKNLVAVTVSALRVAESGRQKLPSLWGKSQDSSHEFDAKHAFTELHAAGEFQCSSVHTTPMPRMEVCPKTKRILRPDVTAFSRTSVKFVIIDPETVQARTIRATAADPAIRCGDETCNCVSIPQKFTLTAEPKLVVLQSSLAYMIERKYIGSLCNKRHGAFIGTRCGICQLCTPIWHWKVFLIRIASMMTAELLSPQKCAT
jgi:hypothetical protein